MTTDWEQITSIIGSLNARLIISEYGGMTVYIPCLRKKDIRSKHAKVHELRDQGMRIRDIASKLKYSETSIRRILKSP